MPPGEAAFSARFVAAERRERKKPLSDSRKAVQTDIPSRKKSGKTPRIAIKISSQRMPLGSSFRFIEFSSLHVIRRSERQCTPKHQRQRGGTKAHAEPEVPIQLFRGLEAIQAVKTVPVKPAKAEEDAGQGKQNAEQGGDNVSALLPICLCRAQASGR